MDNLTRIEQQQFTYAILTNAQIKEACEVVGRAFTHEPMTEALNLSYEQVYDDFKMVVENLIPEGMSFAAIDTATNAIAGVCINKDFTVEPVAEGSDHSDALAVFDLVDELDAQSPELKTLSEHEMFHLYILAVDEAYAGNGVGVELAKHTDELAKALGFKQMIVEVTGPLSQHICIDRIGCQEIGRVNYQDFEFHGEKVFKDIKEVDACLLVRKDLH
jgi:GNAT superfamily N-acetyltransferase